MRHALVLLLALLATFAAERFLDAGVVVALLLGALALCHPEPRRRRRTFQRGQSKVLRFALDDMLGFVMPIAAYFCINKEWRTTTILLYSSFILVALSTRRRNGLISAAIALVMLALEIFLR